MKTWTIALNYIKRTFSSRNVWLFTILMPILFTWVLAAAMSGMGDETSGQATLLLADQDASQWSDALLQLLAADPTLKVVAAPADAIPARIADGQAAAGLILPAGFGAHLSAGQSFSLPFYRNGQRALDAQVAEQSVESALAGLQSLFAARALAQTAAEQLALPVSITPPLSAALEAWLNAAPIRVQVTPVTRLAEDAIPLGAAQSSPGMAVMYVLFLTIGGGAALLTERENGTLARLLVMPVSKAQVLGGNLLGIYLSALAQLILMVLFGRFILGVNWGQSPVGLAFMLLSYAFAATALGVLLAALARSAAQVNALSTIVTLSLAALGGAWWPIEIVPPWMQTLAKALPTYWGMRGFHDLISRGLSWRAILPEAALLMAFGVVFLTVALWRFRWE